MFATNGILDRMIRNYWTTIFGIFGGFVSYLASQGAQLPTTSAGWRALFIAAVYAALGIVAKDATTGSGADATK